MQIGASFLGAVLVACSVCALPGAPGFSVQGRLDDPALLETSGLAASPDRPDLLWALNDSGNAPRLFALRSNAHVLGSTLLDGVRNVDWEDLAAYRDRGEAWLAVADTGDNRRRRRELRIHLLREPEPGAARTAVVRTIRFRWPEGARDCEALAVDLGQRRLLLADKGERPRGLYALPLDPVPGQAVLVAQRLADIPDRWTSAAGSVRLGGVTTAMDLSADGRRLALSTYRKLAVFTRSDGEDWPQALRRAPRVLALPPVALLESFAWAAGGAEAGWMAPEGRAAPLYRVLIPGA